MDMDEDDAFLYGEDPAKATTAEAVEPEEAGSNGISASMAASLAAYGIDPAAAVVEEMPEDGGVEEEDDDDSDSDSDDDDVKLVFTGGPQRTLDLRKPQAPTSNVIGIGKWAHTATANAPAAASPVTHKTPTKAAPAPDALTDYTPSARPGQQPAAAPAQATTELQVTQPVAGNGPPPSSALPHSSLAPQSAPGTDPKIDPTHPTGIIPSTGTSVYDVDVAQFEGSGQMWRRPGSDISDWFNYGFDEVTYPKFLRYRQEMEQGRLALANMGPMGQLTPDVANMLHLPTGVNQQQQMMQMQQMQQMLPQMMAMGGMDPAAMFAMQNQGMQGGMGMMGGMMPGNTGGVDPQGDEENGETGENPEMNQQMNPQMAQQMNQQMQLQNAFPQRGQVVPPRGGAAARGMPVRGRGGAPAGPRGAAMAAGAPKGPKAGRFKDKDRVNESTAAAAAASLDYGDLRDSDAGSRDRSASPERHRERYERDDRDRYGDREERDRYGDDRYGDREERDRYGERGEARASRSSSRRERDHDDGSDGAYDEGERDRHDRRSRRQDSKTSTPAGGLGPEGWESGDDEERRRRKRSRSAEEEAPTRRSTRAKRR